MKPKNIDSYIATFPDNVQALLTRVRRTIRTAAPKATEVISYNIPAFRQNGLLVYFAGFKNHVGLYPPVRGDSALEKAAAKYAGLCAMPMRSVGYCGPVNAVKPGREMVIVSTSSGETLPSRAALAAASAVE